MNDPVLTIRDNAGDALISALTTAGYSSAASRVVSNPDVDTPLPYIRLGNATPPLDFRTKSTEGGTTIHSYQPVAATETEALQLRQIIINTLCRPSTNLSLTSPHRVLMTEMAGGEGAILREIIGDKWYYSSPVNIRYTTVEDS